MQSCRWAFGCSAKHHKCIGLIAPCTLVTCIGRHVCLHNVEAARSTFLQVPDPLIVQTRAAVVSPSGKYIALLHTTEVLPPATAQAATAAACGSVTGAAQSSAADAKPERGHDIVAIYNLKLAKLCAKLVPPEPSGKTKQTRVVDLGFSDGMSKFMFVVWGRSEPQAVLYRWYNSKAICSTARIDFSRMAWDPSSDKHLIGAAGLAAMRLELDADAGTMERKCLQTLNKVRACSHGGLQCMILKAATAHQTHARLCAVVLEPHI